jgi:Meckel syndrome type 1 protein/collagen type III alpha
VTVSGRGGPVVALAAGILAFSVVAVVAQALSMVEVLVRPGEADLLDALGRGGVYFLVFHHAAVAVELPLGPGALTGGAPGLIATVGLTAMAGTALAGATLFVAGRHVARRTIGPPAVAGAALVALSYAALSFGVALLAEAPAPVGFVPEGARLDPRPLSALVWTLGLGLTFTLAGALAAARERGSENRRLRLGAAAVGGGWRMVWSLLTLAFLGLLVVGGLHPGGTRAALDRAFSGGPASGALVVLGTTMLAPNVAATVGSVAMGGSLRLELLGQSCSVLSYTRFPADPSGPFPAGACVSATTSAPPGYLAFLGVPAAAALLGGARAARLAGAGGGRDGVAVGIAAGLAFAAMCTGVLALSWVTIELAGPGAGPLEGSISVGPDLGLGAALALGWGLAGGALGGFLGAGRATGPGDPGPVDASSVGAYGAAGGGPAGGGAAGGGATALLSFHRM